MVGRDTRHRPRRTRRWVAALLVLALAGGGAAAYEQGALDRWLGDDPAAPTGPEAVAPPPGLELPPVTTPRRVAAPITAANGGTLDPELVRRALDPLLAQPDLGRHVLAAVSPLGAGGPVYTRGTGAAVPASTTKILTATAVLARMDPQTRFTTRVLGSGRRVVLVGGGDPLLASSPADATTEPERADVVTLARSTARALKAKGRTRVRVSYDATLFTGPTINPAWPADYVPDGVVAPITSLWVDEGRTASGFGRVDDPPLTAAETFAAALGRNGITVQGRPTAGTAGTGATPLAEVSSATVAEIVDHVLLVSDNEGAEVLSRQLGLATYDEGSASAGTRAALSTLRQLGVPTAGARVYDGSGLSRRNRIAPATLVGALRVAATDSSRPQLRTVVTALPVAGFTGSLDDRFDTGDPAAKGRVRAKTGTLRNVTSLAGVATDREGHPLVFVLMADRVRARDATDAEQALDRAAAALGACRCGAATPAPDPGAGTSTPAGG